MPRHRAISHLWWALTDIDHVGDAAATLLGSALRLAQCAPGAQAGMQLTAQTAAALHIDRPVNRLVRHPHLHIVGKIHHQPPGDLLRAVVVLKPSLHLIMQPLIDRQLARLGPPGPLLGPRLRTSGAIPWFGIPAAVPLGCESVTCAIPPIAERFSVDLAHDRRRCTTKPARNGTNGLLSLDANLDLNALIQRHPRPLPRALARKFRPHPTSVSKPLPTRSHRHADGHSSLSRRHPVTNVAPELTNNQGISLQIHNSLQSDDCCNHPQNSRRQNRDVYVCSRVAPSPKIPRLWRCRGFPARLRLRASSWSADPSRRAEST